MKILITGTAGFIGFHLTDLLLRQGHEVLGLDNINEYYDVNLKFDRLKVLGIDPLKIEYGKIRLNRELGTAVRAAGLYEMEHAFLKYVYNKVSTRFKELKKIKESFDSEAKQTSKSEN